MVVAICTDNQQPEMPTARLLHQRRLAIACLFLRIFVAKLEGRHWFCMCCLCACGVLVSSVTISVQNDGIAGPGHSLCPHCLPIFAMAKLVPGLPPMRQ